MNKMIVFGSATGEIDRRKIPQRAGEVFSYLVIEANEDGLLVLMPKDVMTWCLGTWFSGGLGSVRFTVGLDDLKGLFQPK